VVAWEDSVDQAGYLFAQSADIVTSTIRNCFCCAEVK